ncbi:MAG: RDD family protein [Holophagaceae bacterium]
MTKDTNNLVLETKYAGFWLRFVALIIDYVILGFAAFFMDAGLSLSFESDLETEFSEMIAFLLTWFYFAWMESQYGATFGKQAFKLEVTDINGGRVTFMQATGRYAAKLLSLGTACIGFAMAGFTKKKQGLHDIISECLIIKN